MELIADDKGVSHFPESRRLSSGGGAPLKWKECALLGVGGFSLFFGSVTIQSMVIPVGAAAAFHRARRD